MTILTQLCYLKIRSMNTVTSKNCNYNPSFIRLCRIPWMRFWSSQVPDLRRGPGWHQDQAGVSPTDVHLTEGVLQQGPAALLQRPTQPEPSLSVHSSQSGLVCIPWIWWRNVIAQNCWSILCHGTRNAALLQFHPSTITGVNSSNLNLGDIFNNLLNTSDANFVDHSDVTNRPLVHEQQRRPVPQRSPLQRFHHRQPQSEPQRLWQALQTLGRCWNGLLLTLPPSNCQLTSLKEPIIVFQPNSANL